MKITFKTKNPCTYKIGQIIQLLDSISGYVTTFI